jgi:hypothetical protein
LSLLPVDLEKVVKSMPTVDLKSVTLQFLQSQLNQCRVMFSDEYEDIQVWHFF